MKEFLSGIVSFGVVCAIGFVIYYSGHESLGENIILLDLFGLFCWSVCFAAAHTPMVEDRD